MQVILVLKQSDLEPQATPLDPATFSLRRSARAVLVDASGQIALQYISKDGYHKLPGGGIEDGETIEEALYREVLEETGCHADIAHEIGLVIEHRDYIRNLQESYCYIMRVRGEKGQPHFDEFEQERGSQLVWAASMDAALALIGSQPKILTIAGKLGHTREVFILNKARELLEKQSY